MWGSGDGLARAGGGRYGRRMRLHRSGTIPRLAGQHRSYLERQLDSIWSNARANEIMHANAKDLTALQISQIAAFLSGQQ